eukprot:527706-Amphidinium_carterae.4
MKLRGVVDLEMLDGPMRPRGYWIFCWGFARRPIADFVKVELVQPGAPITHQRHTHTRASNEVQRNCHVELKRCIDESVQNDSLNHAVATNSDRFTTLDSEVPKSSHTMQFCSEREFSMPLKATSSVKGRPMTVRVATAIATHSMMVDHHIPLRIESGARVQLAPNNVHIDASSTDSLPEPGAHECEFLRKDIA